MATNPTHMKIRMIIPYLCPSGDLFSHCKYTLKHVLLRYPKLISKAVKAAVSQQQIQPLKKMGASLVVTSELLWEE